MLGFSFTFVSHDHKMAAAASGITSSQNSFEWGSKKGRYFPSCVPFEDWAKLSQNSTQQTSPQISLAKFGSYTHAWTHYRQKKWNHPNCLGVGMGGEYFPWVHGHRRWFQKQKWIWVDNQQCLLYLVILNYCKYKTMLERLKKRWRWGESVG